MRADILVAGSGIAGLTFALQASEYADVLLVTKKDRVDSNTNYAQGGVAAAVGPGDSPALHVRDTLLAGAGLCHRGAVEELAREGPARVRELMDWGVRFSREGGAVGPLSLGREAGHAQRRILHAADLTGREIERALLAAAERSDRIRILDDHFVWSLRTGGIAGSSHPRCRGAWVLDVRGRRWIEVEASVVLLATGGCGRLFRHTTNPAIATGDGIALGYLAGAAVANLEFMQFHPTALWPTGSRAFLISEAVRGEGAILRRRDGPPFMERYHPAGSLAPRDVVARAIHAELQTTGDAYVHLDASAIPADRFEARFPTITRVCRDAGLEVPQDPIPVVPAAHYGCGGLLTDADGRTTLAGLYAAGEVACTGVHGANRLASNSLLEAVVVSHRAARRLAGELDDLPVELSDGDGRAPRAPVGRSAPPARAAGGGGLPGPDPLSGDLRNGEGGPAIGGRVLETVRDTLWERVGLVRSDESLADARARLEALIGFRAEPRPTAEAMAGREAEFAVLVGRLLVRCAQRRRESRGLHFTESHPYRDNEHFLRDTVLVR